MGASHSHICHPVYSAIIDITNDVLQKHRDQLAQMSSKKRRALKRRIYHYVRIHIPSNYCRPNCEQFNCFEITPVQLSNLKALVNLAYVRAVSKRLVYRRALTTYGSTSNVRQESATRRSPVLETESDEGSDLEELELSNLRDVDNNIDIKGVRMSIYTLTTTVQNAQVDKLPICPICLMDYEEGDRIITLPCFHVYHKECVRSWLHSGEGCAMCRLAPFDLIKKTETQMINDLSTTDIERT
ncbi:uncharacterized protein DEA37_0014388 [Paragonimus westermani]|uniref:RING-type domain-containing protein n=1 Tax=Paragonimus westermani TaxID=34504 RepID=A0A5J4NJ09_9TREM|nr:uncharacterized protein DEA37_0014388 [Paragonimus westermani]